MKQNHMRDQARGKITAIMNHRFARRSLSNWLPTLSKRLIAHPAW
jgi:hypothetical protein